MVLAERGKHSFMFRLVEGLELIYCLHICFILLFCHPTVHFAVCNIYVEYANEGDGASVVSSSYVQLDICSG